MLLWACLHPATLPDLRRVTLDLDDQPSTECIRALASVSGQRVDIWRSRHSGFEVPPRRWTIRLRDATFVEAVFAYQDLGFAIYYEQPDLYLAEGGSAPLARCTADRFAFQLRGIRERIRHDFSDEERTCTVDVGWWCQPDVMVFDVLDWRVTRAVDDLGTDLRVEAPHGRNPLSLALPPAKANRIVALEGEAEFEVPGLVLDCRLEDFGGEKIEQAAGPFRIRAAKEDDWWRIRISSDTDARALAIAEPRIHRRDLRPEPLESGGSGFWVGHKADLEAVTFRIVRTKARIRVPFRFQDVPLPRNP